ncbi:hypothetical protein BBJ28_00006070 [Nothophytophthora sp. Chile5]|nr:hypothetical protein BBJ28_00006070 [Nothophytophthora sp. Chile5]
MAGPPSKYSLFSKQFFTPGSRDLMRMRHTNVSFVDVPLTPGQVEDELLARENETFCCGASTPMGTPAASRASASPRTLRAVRQSRDSFLSLSSTISTASSQLTSPLPQDIRVQGWMYWARHEDSTADDKAQRYTKVYAVLRNEFLLLYRHDQRPSKKVRPSPLVQIAVASSRRSVHGVLHVEDPYGEDMELHLYHREDYLAGRQWAEALEQAAELTSSHFSSFDVKVEDLSRDSMYRGTLHDFRLQRESSFRRSVTQIKKFKSWQSLRQFIPSRLSIRKKYNRTSSP